jgi:hypothetical protein
MRSNAFFDATKLATSVLAIAILGGGFAEPVLPAPALSGSVTEQQVDKLTTEITWYTSLGAAQSAASKENKLILWVHMLGNLDGKT